jgi:shikimate kinase
MVVGAGGGVVVIREDNRDRLRADAVAVTVVYLHAEPAVPGLAGPAQAAPAAAHRRPRRGARPDVRDRDGWYREVADAVVEVRPAHEAGEKPKWRLAERVVEALVGLGLRARRHEPPTRTEVTTR